MDNTFSYAAPENHVAHRPGLSPTLRGGLIDVPREAWENDPRFRGEPQVWLQIHHGLLAAAAELPRRCERLLLAAEADDGDRLKRYLVETRDLAVQLTRHAHGHHHIEDHHFFPLFARAVPALSAHLELLDGDHRVLAETLDEMERATAALPSRPEESAAERRDALLGPTERLLEASGRFDTLFRRHIGDEEEICIPIMLRA